MDQISPRQLDTPSILPEAGPEPSPSTAMRHPTTAMTLALLARIVHGFFVNNPG
jgi:hypothetical protein